MPQRREHPYIWATWLPRLLTGENSCEWAIWFKAHHQNWTKPPSNFDQAQWLLSHTALVNERIRNWEVGGFEVDVEAQNRFELRGRTATLAGRPDIIAHREDEAVIVDAKTGHDSPSHAVQLMIYFHAVPRALDRCKTPSYAGKSRTATIPSVYRQKPWTTRSSRTSALSSDGSRATSQRGACRLIRNAGSATSTPPTVQAAWTTNTSPRAASPTTSDRSSDIADALVSWDYSRRLPANPFLPSESES